MFLYSIRDANGATVAEVSVSREDISEVRRDSDFATWTDSEISG